MAKVQTQILQTPKLGSSNFFPYTMGLTTTWQHDIGVLGDSFVRLPGFPVLFSFVVSAPTQVQSKCSEINGTLKCAAPVTPKTNDGQAIFLLKTQNYGKCQLVHLFSLHGDPPPPPSKPEKKNN